MKAGDCFYGAFRVGQIPHYWIVLCDGDQAGLIPVVNFTTPQANWPKAHTVTPDFFPTLKHDSHVNWSMAIVQEAGKIEQAIKASLFKTCPGLGAEKLGKLIADGDAKKLIPGEIRKRLIR